MDKDCEFNQIFTIMEEAFPREEIRSYKNQKNVFGQKNYSIITSKDSNGNINGFLSFWKLKSINFIEHIAVKEEFRGNGIGSNLVNTYLLQHKSPTILEVEAPLNEINTRRINFYKRAGFYLNLYFYSQPSFIKGRPDVPMYIMSYLKQINFREFSHLRDEIYKHIYFIWRGTAQKQKVEDALKGAL